VFDRVANQTSRDEYFFLATEPALIAWRKLYDHVEKLLHIEPRGGCLHFKEFIWVAGQLDHGKSLSCFRQQDWACICFISQSVSGVGLFFVELNRMTCRPLMVVREE
jgi:hypothetical protein